MSPPPSRQGWVLPRSRMCPGRRCGASRKGKCTGSAQAVVVDVLDANEGRVRRPGFPGPPPLRGRAPPRKRRIPKVSVAVARTVPTRRSSARAGGEAPASAVAGGSGGRPASTSFVADPRPAEPRRRLGRRVRRDRDRRRSSRRRSFTRPGTAAAGPDRRHQPARAARPGPAHPTRHRAALRRRQGARRRPHEDLRGRATLPRTGLLQLLKKHRGRAAFRVEEERRARLVAELQPARLTGIRSP